ncbi:hypothetical protein P280DRAFT_473530 [Massarina eburnea CBS 473.64]|uniref:Uncharacterized protein n=1 Tax=Massarina eburnea CBS 473.64 TaxID=1395130 RepID=A0A6A6RK24_9PLEO|nr:hypothetical protein P280DRAFT_473530 [Massarina eburnea CBS 473.64]
MGRTKRPPSYSGNGDPAAQLVGIPERYMMLEYRTSTFNNSSIEGQAHTEHEGPAAPRPQTPISALFAHRQNLDSVAEMLDLSPVPSDISDRTPSPIQRSPSSLCSTTSDPESDRLAVAFDSLSYHDVQERRIQPWKNKPNLFFTVTGLLKPLPHSRLSTSENHEVLQQLYQEDISRLIRIFPTLPHVPPSAGKGVWQYQHFGRTQKVQKRVAGVRRLRRVMARGVWKFLVDGKIVTGVKHVLDEFPLDTAGEPLGWMVKRHGDWDEQMKRMENMKRPVVLECEVERKRVDVDVEEREVEEEEDEQEEEYRPAKRRRVDW